MVMESISLRHVVLAATIRSPVIFSRARKNLICVTEIKRRFLCRADRRGFGVIRSKISDFQDVQDYAKPLRLCPAKDVNISRENSFVGVGESRCLYKVKLETSRTSGSSLSDLNARVLLCLINEDGNSILRAISAISGPMDVNDQERLSFQRGSVDEFTFEGPKLSRIRALWIGIESGQWRLGGVSLLMINAHKPSSGENSEENLEYFGSKYDFETDEILLGESGDLSMVELKPYLVTGLAGAEPSELLTKNISEQALSATDRISNEESMKEYADLKLSLLLYDSILTLLGTSVASFSLGQTSGISFFVGGVAGLFYLLLLQRSVDRLQVPESVSKNEQETVGFKGPISSLALALGLTALAAKYGTGELPFALTSDELLLGMLGFLACKVAVVFAAVRPIPTALRKSK